MRRKDDSSLVLIDFGAVKESLRGGELGGSTVAGTFGYMPPEQLVGRATPASDLYALGVLIVALATRKPLQEMLDDLNRLQWREHMPSGSAEADGLRALLADLLEPDPSRRLADAALLKRRLDAIGADTPQAPRASPHPVEPWEGQRLPGLAKRMTAAIFHEGQEAATRWWETRALVWPVAATSSFQVPTRGEGPARYTPEDLQHKVCGPPAYAFRYSPISRHPKRAWAVPAGGRAGSSRGVLALDYGQVVRARALYIFTPRHSLAGLQGIHRIVLTDEAGGETIVYNRAAEADLDEGRGPALLIIDLGAPTALRRVHLHAVSHIADRAIIDTAGVLALDEGPTLAGPVDHRPAKTPEPGPLFVNALGNIAGMALLVTLAWFWILKPIADCNHETQREPAASEAAAPAGGSEGAGPTARFVPKSTLGALDGPEIRWATRAAIDAPKRDGGGWERVSPIEDLTGAPGNARLPLSVPEGEIRALSLGFSRAEAPVRRLAILGVGLDGAVAGVILRDADDEEHIWRGSPPRGAAGEVVLATFPRGVQVVSATVILRHHGGAVVLHGAALLGEKVGPSANGTSKR